MDWDSQDSETGNHTDTNDTSDKDSRARAKKKRNDLERKRKGKIKSSINTLADLIPKDRRGSLRTQHITNEVLENAIGYIKHLVDQNKRLMEVGSGTVLVEELDILRSKYDKLAAEKNILEDRLIQHTATEKPWIQRSSASKGSKQVDASSESAANGPSSPAVRTPSAAFGPPAVVSAAPAPPAVPAANMSYKNLGTGLIITKTGQAIFINEEGIPVAQASLGAGNPQLSGLVSSQGTIGPGHPQFSSFVPHLGPLGMGHPQVTGLVPAPEQPVSGSVQTSSVPAVGVSSSGATVVSTTTALSSPSSSIITTTTEGTDPVPSLSSFNPMGGQPKPPGSIVSSLPAASVMGGVPVNAGGLIMGPGPTPALPTGPSMTPGSQILSVPSAHGGLPTALILPNGQVIPVVAPGMIHDGATKDTFGPQSGMMVASAPTAGPAVLPTHAAAGPGGLMYVTVPQTPGATPGGPAIAPAPVNTATQVLVNQNSLYSAGVTLGLPMGGQRMLRPKPANFAEGPASKKAKRKRVYEELAAKRPVANTELNTVGELIASNAEKDHGIGKNSRKSSLTTERNMAGSDPVSIPLCAPTRDDIPLPPLDADPEGGSLLHPTGKGKSKIASATLVADRAISDKSGSGAFSANLGSSTENARKASSSVTGASVTGTPVTKKKWNKKKRKKLGDKEKPTPPTKPGRKGSSSQAESRSATAIEEDIAADSISLSILPDTITFDSTDIDSVLDQVENFIDNPGSEIALDDDSTGSRGRKKSGKKDVKKAPSAVVDSMIIEETTTDGVSIIGSVYSSADAVEKSKEMSPSALESTPSSNVDPFSPDLSGLERHPTTASSRVVAPSQSNPTWPDDSPASLSMDVSAVQDVGCETVTPDANKDADKVLRTTTLSPLVTATSPISSATSIDSPRASLQNETSSAAPRSNSPVTNSETVPLSPPFPPPPKVYRPTPTVATAAVRSRFPTSEIRTPTRSPVTLGGGNHSFTSVTPGQNSPYRSWLSGGINESNQGDSRGGSELNTPKVSDRRTNQPTASQSSCTPSRPQPEAQPASTFTEGQRLGNRQAQPFPSPLSATQVPLSSHTSEVHTNKDRQGSESSNLISQTTTMPHHGPSNSHWNGPVSVPSTFSPASSAALSSHMSSATGPPSRQLSFPNPQASFQQSPASSRPSPYSAASSANTSIISAPQPEVFRPPVPANVNVRHRNSSNSTGGQSSKGLPEPPSIYSELDGSNTARSLPNDSYRPAPNRGTAVAAGNNNNNIEKQTTSVCSTPQQAKSVPGRSPNQFNPGLSNQPNQTAGPVDQSRQPPTVTGSYEKGETPISEGKSVDRSQILAALAERNGFGAPSQVSSQQKQPNQPEGQQQSQVQQPVQLSQRQLHPPVQSPYHPQHPQDLQQQQREHQQQQHAINPQRQLRQSPSARQSQQQVQAQQQIQAQQQMQAQQQIQAQHLQAQQQVQAHQQLQAQQHIQAQQQVQAQQQIQAQKQIQAQHLQAQQQAIQEMQHLQQQQQQQQFLQQQQSPLPRQVQQQHQSKEIVDRRTSKDQHAAGANLGGFSTEAILRGESGGRQRNPSGSVGAKSVPSVPSGAVLQQTTQHPSQTVSSNSRLPSSRRGNSNNSVPRNVNLFAGASMSDRIGPGPIPSPPSSVGMLSASKDPMLGYPSNHNITGGMGPPGHVTGSSNLSQQPAHHQFPFFPLHPMAQQQQHPQAGLLAQGNPDLQSSNNPYGVPMRPSSEYTTLKEKPSRTAAPSATTPAGVRLPAPTSVGSAASFNDHPLGKPSNVRGLPDGHAALRSPGNFDIQELPSKGKSSSQKKKSSGHGSSGGNSGSSRSNTQQTFTPASAAMTAPFFPSSIPRGLPPPDDVGSYGVGGMFHHHQTMAAAAAAASAAEADAVAASRRAPAEYFNPMSMLNAPTPPTFHSVPTPGTSKSGGPTTNADMFNPLHAKRPGSIAASLPPQPVSSALGPNPFYPPQYPPASSQPQARPHTSLSAASQFFRAGLFDPHAPPEAMLRYPASAHSHHPSLGPGPQGDLSAATAAAAHVAAAAAQMYHHPRPPSGLLPPTPMGFLGHHAAAAAGHTLDMRGTAGPAMMGQLHPMHSSSPFSSMNFMSDPP